MELANKDWYKLLLEEIGSTVVETVFQAQSTLLDGKLKVGQLLNAKVSNQYPITDLIMFTSADLKISERELWYCTKFATEFKNLEKMHDFHSKAISWNKVKKMLADPEKAKKPCKHDHKEKIVICIDCGKRVDD